MLPLFSQFFSFDLFLLSLLLSFSVAALNGHRNTFTTDDPYFYRFSYFSFDFSFCIYVCVCVAVTDIDSVIRLLQADRRVLRGPSILATWMLVTNHDIQFIRLDLLLYFCFWFLMKQTTSNTDEGLSSLTTESWIKKNLLDNLWIVSPGLLHKILEINLSRQTLSRTWLRANVMIVGFGSVRVVSIETGHSHRSN